MGLNPDADNLSDCDRDRAPDAIQPHGALLSLNGAGIVTRLAGNTIRALGLAPEALLGRRIDVLVGRDGLVLAEALANGGSPLAAYVARWKPRMPGRDAWDVTAHATAAGTIVEFEPAPDAPRSAAEGLGDLSHALAVLEAPENLDTLFQVTAAAVRRLAGFDRVTVCRLLDDGTGVVIAEARGDALPSLLDHRLRDSDVCREARMLSARHGLRAIPNASYVPAPLRPAEPDDAPSALDMSDCALRSVSPAFLHYLSRLGVAASLSIAVVVNGRLWGLIACHHGQPRCVPYEVREACRQVARIFSERIGVCQEALHHQQTTRLRELRHTWLDGLRRVLDSGRPIEPDVAALAELIPCDGMAVVSAGRVALAGRTPSKADVVVLAEWLEEPLGRGVFSTGHPAAGLPSAATSAEQTGGLLATSVGISEPITLMWFRTGEADRAAQSDHLHTPSGKSGLPSGRGPWAFLENGAPSIAQTARGWTRAEISGVRQLGRSLTALIQQQTLRELNSRLRDAVGEQQALVEQKNLLMQEVHHRVQNSLQIVNSMLQVQARQTTDPRVRDQFDGAVNRLMAVGAVHRHLGRSSDAQNVRLGPYLRELCTDLMVSWGDGWSGHVTVTAWDGAIPSHMAVTLALLVTELLTNAAKYAYAGAPGPVAVLVSELDGDRLQVAVRDHGLGMRDKVQGGGLGSKLIRIFTSQLGGSVDTRTGAEGTTVSIVVPLSPRGGVQPAGAGAGRPA